ncbi:hypothetical protein, partial [Pseudomonas sp.]|uniref:hypothetical protein n=2 Tax=Pseudomonas TaxID=286 RepID=UPI001D54642C
ISQNPYLRMQVGVLSLCSKKVPWLTTIPVGAGAPANTGAAGAIHRAVRFTGTPAPTIRARTLE